MVQKPATYSQGVSPQVSTPEQLASRICSRVAKAKNLDSMRVPKASDTDSQQDMRQGYQGVNTPLTPQTDRVIHKPGYPSRQETPDPPRGCRTAPKGRGGQVAASRLMAGKGGEGAKKTAAYQQKKNLDCFNHAGESNTCIDRLKQGLAGFSWCGLGQGSDEL